MSEGGPKPWERRKGESRKAYEAFALYRGMGAGRSYTKVAQELNKSRTLIARWAQRWAWTERVQAYDADQEEQEEAARREALKKKAELWAERREQEREREWQVAQALAARAEQMLQFPLTTREVERTTDGEVVHIHPAGWRFRDIVRFHEIAAKLARLSAEMPTDHRALSAPDGGPLRVDADMEVDLVKFLSQFGERGASILAQITDLIAEAESGEDEPDGLSGDGVE